MNQRRWPVLALAILLLGFAVRVHDLGADAFWYDEVMQLQVATAPTYFELLRQLRFHAMALPLDYTTIRFTAAIGGGEFFLRFPALLWGTLALALTYRLGRMVARPPIALLGLLMTVGWTLQVRFSQELRNYASLGALYLAGTIVLLWALQNQTAPPLPPRFQSSRRLTAALARWPILRAWRWLAVAVLFWVGSYFHSFVLFAFANGYLAWLVAPLPRPAKLRALVSLVLVTLAVGVLFLPGYYFFGRQHYDYALYEFSRTFWRVVSQGLGWINVNYADEGPLFGLWEGVVSTGLGLGLIALVAQPARHRWLWALAVGTAAQVLVVYVGDVIRGYWFLSRQLVHLGPAVHLLAAAGWCAAGQALARLIRRPALRLAVPLAAGILVLVGMPAALRIYYTYDRSTAREVAAVLAADWQPGRQVLVIPSYDWRTYAHYLHQYPHGPALVESLQLADWTDLDHLPTQPGTIYLAVNHRTTPEQYAQIQALGFTPLYERPDHWLGAQSLFVRKIGYN